MSERIISIHEKLNRSVEEEYKVLRTNIQFCGVDKSVKVFAVTSFSPAEGKTTTAVNIAVSMAMAGLKTLLLDADLRKSRMERAIGKTVNIGLSNILSGSVAFEDAINTTNVDNLFFVACGPNPPNPAEMVGSEKFREVIEKARQQYDMVVIDTPPLGNVIDSALVSAYTDGAVIVVRSGKVNRRDLLSVKAQLEKVNARILGVVLNRMKRGTYRKSYRHYRYYNETAVAKRRWLSVFRRPKVEEKLMT